MSTPTPTPSLTDKTLYIFNNLPNDQKLLADNNFRTDFIKWQDEPRGLRPSWLEQPGYQLNPNTFDNFIEKFPRYTEVFTSQSGGSRRSLQKSRFLKRKSRKYKSIKKSKKRSFRNRGRH